MITLDFITALFYEIDEQLGAIPKHPEAGIVSKSVRKPAARLTLFQDSSRCQVAGKQRDDKYLESFESIEQNVKSVNLRLGSVRRSPKAELYAIGNSTTLESNKSRSGYHGAPGPP
jgi:hypothetical protein